MPDGLQRITSRALPARHLGTRLGDYGLLVTGWPQEVTDLAKRYEPIINSRLVLRVAPWTISASAIGTDGTFHPSRPAKTELRGADPLQGLGSTPILSKMI
jgi:hypothetical protein